MASGPTTQKMLVEINFKDLIILSTGFQVILFQALPHVHFCKEIFVIFVILNQMDKQIPLGFELLCTTAPLLSC